MSRIIEAKAVLTAEDRTGRAFDALARRMKDGGKGMKVSADVDRLSKSLADVQRKLEAIDRFRSSQSAFGASRSRFRTTQQDVERLAKELEAAKHHVSQFDGITSFNKHGAIAKEMADASARVNELDRALIKARRDVSGASAEFEAQSTALKGAKREVDALGLSLNNLGEEEARLKNRAEATTKTLERQRRIEADRPRVPSSLPQPPHRELETRAGGRAFGAGESAALGALRYGAAAAGVAGGGVLVADTFRRAYRSALDFERSMIEVGKATDTSGAELNAYGERILKLSRDTGKTKEELSSMLSAAGFSGRPKQELMDFTEYGAKATVAWQTSAEETGQALAELGNIYNANQKRIEEIGDAINVMADNSASRETDLLEFLRRAGASGKTAGIAAEEMLAFGAAMKEVGVRNEVAGTGMEALLNVMKLGAEFSKKAGAGLKELGVDSDKMRKAFVAKPVETMVDLLEKLNKVADPLKKAEIMTNLFGKEYQDDIAKVLNALPQITKYLALMKDKAAIANGGVRFQFAQNLDKDVMKIERATAAINVLMTRMGEPIKVQAGGIADQINSLIDRLESGDTILQRIMSRVTGAAPGDPPVPLELPKVNGEDTLEDWAKKNVPWLGGDVWNNYLDNLIGKTGKEAAARARGETPEARAAERARTLARPAEIEEQIKAQGHIRDASKQTAREGTGMRRTMAAKEVVRAEGEIERLRGELVKAWEAIGELRVREQRERGALGINGETGETGESIGPGRFGFGIHGSTIMPERTVPLPPERPAELPQPAGPDSLPRAATALEGAAGSLERAAGRIVPPTRPDGAGGDPRLDRSLNGEGGPITAEVRTLPPLSGEVTGQAQVTGQITVIPSQWFQTEFSGIKQSVMQLSGRVASIGAAAANNGPGSTGKSSPDAGKGSRD